MQYLKTDNFLLTALVLKFIAFCFYDLSGLRMILQPASFLFLVAYLCSDKKSSYSPVALLSTLSLLSLTAANIFLAQSASEYALTFLITLLYGLVCGLAVQAKSAAFISHLVKYIALIVLLRILYIDLIFLSILIFGHSAGEVIGNFSTLDFAWYTFEFTLVRISDQAIVLYPIVIALIFASNMRRALIILVLSTLAILINFNIAACVAYIAIFASFLFFWRRYFFLFCVSALAIILVALMYENILLLINLKSASFELKLFQLIYIIQNASDFMFGQGVGSIDETLFRKDDFLIENSYLYLFYALGIFSFPIFLYLASLSLYIFYRLFNTTTPNLFALYACLVSILVLSGSNPYLFSGSIYVIFYILSKNNIKAIG